MHYEEPTVVELGTVAELTQQIDKCGGSGDEFLPQLLSPVFAEDCDD
jgi:hypothetical protein